jgi:hypothetical protein
MASSSTRRILQRRSLSTTDDLIKRRGASDDDASPNAPQASKTIHKPPTLPPVIPDIPRYRTLILCFDGTGDQFDADNSNVVRLVSLLKKDDQDKQLVYYQVRSWYGLTLPRLILISPHRLGLAPLPRRIGLSAGSCRIFRR